MRRVNILVGNPATDDINNDDDADSSKGLGHGLPVLPFFFGGGPAGCVVWEGGGGCFYNICNVPKYMYVTVYVASSILVGVIGFVFNFVVIDNMMWSIQWDNALPPSSSTTVSQLDDETLINGGRGQ